MTFEDLESKNGTCVLDRRVKQSVQLLTRPDANRIVTEPSRKPRRSRSCGRDDRLPIACVFRPEFEHRLAMTGQNPDEAFGDTERVAALHEQALISEESGHGHPARISCERRPGAACAK